MLGKRLINTGSAATPTPSCTTDTLQILGDTSCIAYYKMSDATDESGNYDGTPSNVNFNVAGKFGNAGDFNGSSSYISVPNSAGNNISTFSVSFWFKTSGQGSTGTLVNNGGADSTQTGWYIAILSTGFLRFVTSQSGNSPNNIGTTNYADNSWHNVVLAYTAVGVGTSTYNMYVDGNSTPEISGTNGRFTTTSTQPLTIGRFARTSVGFFNGSIDQVRIFNKALSSTEVTTLNDEVYCQPTIVPTDNFNTVLYTGNNSTNVITTVGFQPDLSWFKNRQAGNSNALVDSVRGRSKVMFSDVTTEEQISDSNKDLVSFDINGFTLGAVQRANSFNKVDAANNIVAWNWYAPTAESIGASGSRIASTIKKNVDAGFSIVSWTGNGNDATVGTGLSQQAELVITKGRANLATFNNWITYHKDLSTNYHLYLNTSDSEQNGAGDYFRDSAFTSEVFGIGNDIYGPNVNGTTMIAYAFHSVDGYSKIGSYVGTGASGNNIVTGFRPAFVMWKAAIRPSGGGSWYMYDNKRTTSNPQGQYLQANESAIEADGTSVFNIDFNSNGFTINGTNNEVNQNGSTYIFLAFAEEVFNPNGVTRNATNPFGDASELALYKFEDNATNSEDSVTAASTAVSYATGYIDKAAVFDGSSSFIDLGNSAPFGDRNDIKCISGWIKLNGITNNTIDNAWLYSVTGASDSIKWFYIAYRPTSNSIQVYRRFDASNTAYTTATITPDTEWHHIVAQLTATEVEIYLDGNKLTTTNTNTGTGTNTTWIDYPNYAGTIKSIIGKSRQSGPKYYDGKIDQVRMFNRALDSGEILQLYNE